MRGRPKSHTKHLSTQVRAAAAVYRSSGHCFYRKVEEVRLLTHPVFREEERE